MVGTLAGASLGTAVSCKTEGEGQEVACHYCNNRENISKEDIAQLITQAQAKLN